MNEVNTPPRKKTAYRNVIIHKINNVYKQPEVD